MKPTFGTFGIYRWFLATMVLFCHLGPEHCWRCGPNAVVTFFILSGYIISYILDTHYLRIPDGIRKYYINRMLRVYPAYWVVIFATIPLIKYFPDIAHHVSELVMPRTPMDVILNMGAITQNFANTNLVPPAWSLGVEMEIWLLLPFVLRSRSGLWKFLLFVLFIKVSGVPVSYYGPLFAIQPFALGLLLYYRKQKNLRDIPHAVGMASIIFTLLFYVCLSTMKIEGFYADIILSVLVIYYLSGIDAGRLPRWFKRCDDFLGELAYPLFLINSLTGILVKICFPSLDYRSWGMFAVGFPVANILAVFMIYAIESPINRLRRRIRN